MGQIITQERADQLFKLIVAEFVRDVNILTAGVSLEPHQFDALVSFAYNAGPDMDHDGIAEGLGDSTLLKKVKANPKDYAAITAQFMQWNKSGGKVLAGLTRRRKSEAYLYQTGELNFFQ
jgi:lysozyme